MERVVDAGDAVAVWHFHADRWRPFATGVVVGGKRPSATPGRYYFSVEIRAAIDPLCFLTPGHTWHSPSVRRWMVRPATSAVVC